MREETKLLITLGSEGVNFSSSVPSSLASLSSRLKIIHDGKNHGGQAIGRHFVFNFRLRGYPAYFYCFYISADVNRNIIEQH